MNVSKLGRNIKTIRNRKGWSLNKLKQKSGIGYATLHDIENGKSQNLNSSNLEKIAKALNVTANELLEINVMISESIDLEETLKNMLKSDKLRLDGILLNHNDIEELRDLFKVAINNIKRRKKAN